MNHVDPSTELRFLIADPLAGVQSFARKLLESYGFSATSIRCVDDPGSALALAGEFSPDFLITDWFADAAMTGLDLHERICAIKPGCRLALLSFHVTPEHQAAADRAGSRFLLRKPFVAQDLQDTMRSALAKLAIDRPELHQRFSAVANRQAAKPESRPPPPIELPKFVPLRPGDKVVYREKTDTVQHVVISQGQLIVHLKGTGLMVPATKLRRL